MKFGILIQIETSKRGMWPKFEIQKI